LICIRSGAQPSHYAKKFKPIAKSLSREFKIPYEVILGVAIIESGEGNTAVSRLHNNHFGIVGKHKTKGKHPTKYRHFASAQASYHSFCTLVKRRRFYEQLKGNPDYKVWVDSLSRTGYSTQPLVWKKKVLDVIVKQQL
jgi:flagellum-specific peptidoglycan hydrolase FlgJ